MLLINLLIVLHESFLMEWTMEDHPWLLHSTFCFVGNLKLHWCRIAILRGIYLIPWAFSDIGTPQLDSKVSLASQASPQVVRCSIRPRASQENSATPQVSRASSQEGNTSPPPTVGLTTPRVLPWKNLTLSGSLTCPANLWLKHKGLF